MARRRYQRGSVFQNRTKTAWLGAYSSYVLDLAGVEIRERKQIVLGTVHKADGTLMPKREAQRLLQPYLDRVNSSISAPVRQSKSATFEAFAEIWERDYLCLSKLSTQATMRGHLKRMKKAFGPRDMRQIGAAEVQRVVATMEAEGYSAKTIRNLWTTMRLIWDAALAQTFVDRVLPKPKLPRMTRSKPRYFRLEDVAKIIASQQGEQRAFFWLAAETGLRAGELFGLELTDVEKSSVSVNRSVWNGNVGTPKTSNAVRRLAVSSELVNLLSEQMKRQREKGHAFLFSTSTGTPVDANLFRRRKMGPLLTRLEIRAAGYHAFRHFNGSLLNSLRVPLKTIQERLGHAMTGSLTLDVYTHSEWSENVEAASVAGKAIQNAVNSVCLTAIQQKGLPTGVSEALQLNNLIGCGGQI